MRIDAQELEMTKEEFEKLYPNAMSVNNDKDDQCAKDYIKHLTPPGPEFDAHNFHTKALLLIEKEIKSYLSQRNRKTNVKTFKLINYARALHKNDDLWDAIHNIRQIRNKYAHELDENDKKQELIDNFLSHSEHVHRYDGRQKFPFSNSENQQQVRVYIATTLIWEYLCRLNGASDSFSPTYSIMSEYIDQVNN